MVGTTTKKAMFFEVRASWIILGYFSIRMPELCQEEIEFALSALKLSALGMEKSTMTMRMIQSGHLLFSPLISLDSVWFVVGCFEGFFSPCQGQVLYQT